MVTLKRITFIFLFLVIIIPVAHGVWAQECPDSDGDGFQASICGGTDCDDSDPNVNPNAAEICDGKDSNCDGWTLWTDVDADGDGVAFCAGDCNDNDNTSFPGAQEICGDGKDNNCNWLTDEPGCICPDADGDGATALYCGGTDCDDSDPAVQTNCVGCTDSDGDGISVEGGKCGPVDCDDTDPTVKPGAAEICDGKDTNCDGWKPPTDTDNDGDGTAVCAGDCNDNDADVRPGAAELCDGIDNNCDNFLRTDERDTDGDGFRLCDAVADCNDLDATIYPGAAESCGDGKDNNCNSLTDEDPCVCPDNDNDGFTASFCGGNDCDDSNDQIKPGATEICDDAVDNDCDGLTDVNDPSAVNCPFCSDGDGDGYFVEGGACGPVDCDDTDGNVHPDAAEICDGKDSNCDGWKAATDVDADGDGVALCANDCDDSDPSRYPGAAELCDGVDNNCDFVLRIDERDNDSDGFLACDAANPDCDDNDFYTNPAGDEWCTDGKDNNCDGTIDEAVCICPDADGDGFLAAFCGGTDCNDVSDTVFPGAVEICDDGLDNDCDGLIDIRDPDAVNCPVCTDNDNDTFYVEGGACGAIDCDDSDPAINPGAAEICDGKDNDCDGWKPSSDVDNDNDGVALCGGDCDDNNPDRFPGNLEHPLRDTCNDFIDNDCDTLVDANDNDCVGSCDAATSPKDPPHFFTLMDPGIDPIDPSDDTIHPDNSRLNCEKCHAPDFRDPVRYACQRCHAAPTADPNDLNGTFLEQYPMDVPYGFGSAPEVNMHVVWTMGDKGCVVCHNPHAQEQDNLFGTDYGKYIKEYVCYDPKGIEEFVEFTAPVGTGSFADGPPYNANICEMCHTQTNHHQTDGTAPGGQDHYNGNNCTQCHPHIDGFAPTGGVPPAPHDTQEFIDNCDYCHVTPTDFSTKIPDAKCEQCHTPAGSLKTGFPTAPDVITHSDASGSGSYVYSNACVDCHNPMVELPNLKFIRPDILNTVVPGSVVEFTAYTGAGSFADGPPHEENVCETCHSQTKHHQADGTATGGQDHFNGQDCASCHLHTKGFLPDCAACHDSPPATGTHAIHFGGTADQAAYGSTSIAQDLTVNGSVYLMNCGNCHPIDGSQHLNSIPNSGGGVAEIELYDPAAPAGSLKAMNPPAATYTPGATTVTYSQNGFTFTATVGGTCSNVYCHSGPQVETVDPVTGATPPAVEIPMPTRGTPSFYPLSYDPPWQDFVSSSRVYQSPQWGVDSLGCNGCHGYPIMSQYPTVSAGAGDSHGWVGDFGYLNLHVWNMGFDPLQCNTCHVDTVTDDFTWIRDDFSIQLDDISIQNRSKHINGTKDVAFTPVPVLYQTTLGDVNYDLSTASFDPVSRTCTNVGCHQAQTSVEWGTPYRWWNGFECNICHRR